MKIMLNSKKKSILKIYIKNRKKPLCKIYIDQELSKEIFNKLYEDLKNQKIIFIGQIMFLSEDFLKAEII